MTELPYLEAQQTFGIVVSGSIQLDFESVGIKLDWGRQCTEFFVETR